MVTVTVPCDAAQLNAMVRFWITLSFEVLEEEELEFEITRTSDLDPYPYKEAGLAELIDMAEPVHWADDLLMEDALYAKIRSKLITRDFSPYDLVDALGTMYTLRDEFWNGTLTRVQRKLRSIILSAILLDYAKFTYGDIGEDLRRLKAISPELAYDIDMGLVWWHQKQMAELRGDL